MENDNYSQLKEQIKELKAQNEQLQKANQFYESIFDNLSLSDKNNYQALKEKIENFKAFYENSPVPYQSLDKDGYIINVNPSWLNTLGYEKEEVVGAYFGSFLHRDWKATFEKKFPEFKRKGNIHNAEYRMQHKKGYNLDVIFEGWTNYANHGKFQTYCVFKNITRRKKSEEALKKSEQQFRQLFEKAAIGIFIADDHHNTVDANEKALSILGYSKEGILQIDAHNLIHPDDINKTPPNDNVKKMNSGENIQLERRYCRKEGDYINVLVNMGIFGSNKDRRLHMIMFQDITQRKQAEKELQIKNRISNSFIQSEGESFYKNVLDIMRDEFSSEYGFFGYINDEGDLVAESMTKDVWNECQIEDKSIVLRENSWGGIWGESLKQRKTFYKNGNLQLPEGHVQLTSAVATPIMANNQLIGQIALANKAKGYNDKDKKLIQQLSDYIAPLLHSRLKEEQYKQELIKAKEKAEKSEEKYKALVDNTPDFIYSLDKNSRHTAVNKSICLAMNRDAKDIIGKNHIELGFPKEIAEEWREKHLQVLNTGNSMQFETTTPMPDDTVKTYEAILSPIFDANKNVVGIRGISRDITAKKQTEQELIKAKEKAEESDRLKSAFLANMSHEIRTPMNGIMGFSQLLQEDDYSKEDQQNFLDIIHSRSRHLLYIIDDLVDVSKIEANQLTLNFQPFHLNDVMQELYNIFYNELNHREKNHLYLEVHLGLNYTESYIESDLNRFKQIMDNLLKNAIKFTRDGTIEFGYDSWYKNNLLFYVKDSGIGIPNDQQENIFDRFRQGGDSTSKKHEGTGLGLTISKSLVELLGGEMWMKSTEGEGSVFYFTLPYEVKQSDEKEAGKETTQNIHGMENKTILLIEDDPVSNEYIKELLKPNGLNLITCKTGQEGYEKFMNNPGIDLILMDIKLPDKNGLDITKNIRASSANNNVPIIAQTAYAMSGDAQKSKDAGCDDYISKPVEKEKLLEIIRKNI